MQLIEQEPAFPLRFSCSILPACPQGPGDVAGWNSDNPKLNSSVLARQRPPVVLQNRGLGGSAFPGFPLAGTCPSTPMGHRRFPGPGQLP